MDDDDDPTSRGPGRPVLARVIERHRQVRRAVLQRLRFVYDGNGDGVVDEIERQTLKDDLVARCEARRTRLLETYAAETVRRRP